MRQILRIAAFLAMLLPGVAVAQCNSSTPLPANSVLGRLGIGPGPCQAIPFSQLSSKLTGAAITLNSGNGQTAPGAMSGGNTFSFGANTDTPRFAGIGLGGAAPATGLEVFNAPATPSSNGQGVFGATTINGGVLGGQGSTYDAVIANKAGAVALGVTTGTQNVVLQGTLTAPSLSTAGTIAGSLCMTSGGLVLYEAAINCFAVSGITVVSGKALTVDNTIELAGTDGTKFTFPGASDTVDTLAANQTISGNKTFSGTLNITGTGQLNGAAFGTFATQNYATPPAIGGTTPNTGAFSTLSATTPIGISSGGTNANTAAGARASGGLNIDQLTSRGDSNYTILATDRRVGTSSAFTAARTWTLPAASSVNAGQELIIADYAGGVSNTNTLTVQRAGSDTVNGATSVTISVTNGAYLLLSDGVSRWTAQALGAAATVGVASINGQTGNPSIVSGTGVSVSTSGGNITVASTGFTQKGGSGANRSLQSKGEDFVSVYDFNTSACDGLTDTAPIINTALSNISTNTRGILRIAIYGADCILNSSINLPSQVTLEGSGRNGSFGLSYTPATGSAITTTGGVVNKMSAVRGLLIKQPNSIAPIINFIDCHTCKAEDNWLNGGSGVSSVGILYQSTVSTATITAITKAASAVVTAVNTYSNGDSVFIQSVVGMTQINGLFCTVSSVSGSGFTCSNINSSGFSVYTSGGTATKIVGDSGLGRVTNNYMANLYYGIIFDTNVNSPFVGWNRIQPIANGVCIYTYSASAITGFPNQGTYLENTCESPSAGVVGNYFGATATGFNVISNRFEGANMTALSVTSGATKIGLLKNYYSVSSMLSDPGNAASGDDDAVNKWIPYTATVSCNAGTITTQSQVLAYKKINSNTTMVSGQHTITTLGSCTGNLTYSLPNTANRAAAGTGVNSNSGGALQPIISPSGTTFLSITTPVATTYFYTLTYENQ